MKIQVSLSASQLREKLGDNKDEIKKIVDLALSELPNPRDYLESLTGDERLKESAIDGLDKKINSIKLTNGGQIYGPGKTKIIRVDLSSQLNGVTKTFPIGTHFGIVDVLGSSSPFVFREIIDYTEVGTTIVFDASIDASVSLASGQTLIVKCLK